jgi:hypothetical protein
LNGLPIVSQQLVHEEAAAMKTKTIYFWGSTIWVVCIMAISGGLSVTHAQVMMEGYAHLGYPAYFANLLGVAKLLGVGALLAPGRVRLKEWAYAGFAITIISAAYSHLFSGDGLKALEPLATLAALAVSYWTRPVDRRVFSLSTPATRLEAVPKAQGAR